MREEGCRAQKEKGKEDKAPLLSPLQIHVSRVQPGRPPFCFSSPGIEELNSGFAAGSAQPDFAPSCSECTCLHHGRDLGHWRLLAMSQLSPTVSGRSRV